MSQFDDELDAKDDGYEDDPDAADEAASRRSASNPFSSGAFRAPGSGTPTPNRVNDPSRLPGGANPVPRPGMGGGTPGSSGGLPRPNPSPYGGGSSGSGSSPLNRPAAPTPGGGSGSSPVNRPATPTTPGGSSQSSQRPGSAPPSGAPANRDREKSGGGLLGRFGGSDKDDKKADKASGGGFGGLGKGLTSRFGGGSDDKPATPKGTARTGDNKSAGGGLLGRFGRGGDAKPSSPTSSGSMSSASAAPRFGSAGTSSPFGGGAPGGKPATPKAPKAPGKSIGERLKGLSPFTRGTAKPARQRQPKPVSVSSEGMSLDTKLDILGVALILSALALIFSAMSTTQGQLTGGINHFLGQNLGWGALAAPVAMFAVGVWLILRHFGENAPTLKVMTLVGIAMLYVGLLVLFQYIDSFGYVMDARFSALQQLRLIFLPQSYLSERGGGWVGAEIYYFLVSNITEIGGFFILVAWMIIGVMLSVNISAAQLAMAVISVWRSYSDARRRRALARAIERGDQGVAAPGLPQIAVSKPAPDQLAPGARAPQLPLPVGGAAEERSIPIMAGGRAPAPFKPAESVPLDQPATLRPAAVASAGPTRAAEGPAAGGGGSRFGGFAARMRGAIPTPGAKPDAADNGKPSGKQAADNGNGAKNGGKPTGGLFGSLTARVRDAIPAVPIPIPLPGNKPSDSALKTSDADRSNAPAARAADAPAKPAAPSVPFAAQSLTPPVASMAAPAFEADEDEADQKPPAPAIRPSSVFTRPGSTASPAAPTANRPPGSASSFGFSSDLDDVDDEDDADENGAPPTRLGTLLKPTPTSSAASGVRPGFSRPTPPTPSGARPSAPLGSPFAKPSTPPASDEGDDEDAMTTPASTESPARSTPPQSFAPAIPRPSASSLRPPTPAIPRPSTPALDADEDDEDAEDDLNSAQAETDDDPSTLAPARPKGLGPLPRPSLSTPFSSHAVPTTPPNPGAVVPTPPRPMGTLQERMEALRANRASDAPGETDSRSASDEAVTPPTEATTQASPPVAPSAPAAKVGVFARPANNEVDDDDGEGNEIDAMPTLTQPRSLGIKPFGTSKPPSATPPAPSTPTPAPPKPASSSSAPAAFRMPEAARPPTPIRPPSYEHSDAPPASTLRSSANGDDTPAPPKPLRQGRHNWTMPDPGRLLAAGADQERNNDALRKEARKVEETLSSFGAPGRVVEIRTGPVITQFGVEPDYLAGRNGKKIRVKVSAIAQLDKDIQLALGAKSIRIEAPVPGKGYVGIEVPNPEPSVVRLRDVLESQEFQRIKSPLGIALGQGVDGTPVAADLGGMPHLLIAGTTGSGKSVCVNTIIASLLISNSPDRLKFIMVDPKRVELTGYNGIPHLVAPVVVELERIVSVLKWVTREMDERYKKFSSAGARNIEDFNKHLPQTEPVMPYIVVIIDELADLMMLAPDETERVITRIAALARATGIHLVIATQRPSVDVVTGLIKANFPARIAFAVAGGVDSRVILDQPGAEKLLGRGDMLYMSGDSPAPVRLQGVYVSDTEINNITRFWREQASEDYLAARPIMPPSGMSMDDTGRDVSASSGYNSRGAAQRQPDAQIAFWDRELSDSANNRDDDEAEDGEDAVYDEAVELVRRLNKASVSLLQRRLRIGYTRAARLIDIMEQRGIVGPAVEGSKPRDVIG